MSKDLYNSLGISRNASLDEVKKSFKKLAMQHHPDKGGDEEKFKEISHAYEVLSDEEKRRRYDLTGQDGDAPPNPFEHAGFSPFGTNPFDFLFNNRGPVFKHEDVIHNVEITLEEAYKGVHKTLNMIHFEKCTCCSECLKCGGRGTVQAVQSIGPVRQIFQIPCDRCQTKGFSHDVNCKLCSNGQRELQATCKLELPPGTRSGSQNRVQGKGVQAFKTNEVPGDLVLIIKVSDHPLFKVEGDDLIYQIEIDLWDAMFSTTLSIPHFGGELKVDTKQFGILRENEQYIVKHKGMKTSANLVLKFKLKYPDVEQISEEDRNMLKTILKKTL